MSLEGNPIGSEALATETTAVDDPRERILDAAYNLFCRQGVRATGIDRIVVDAGVARMTLYRHFHSKDELVRAILDRRERLWTRDWLERELEVRGGTAKEKLLTIFDLFDEWFHREDYEGCLFIACLVESHDRSTPIGSASASQLANVYDLLLNLTQAAGADDPGTLAGQWQMLMAGSMVAAMRGELDAARGARDVGSLLLADIGDS